MKLKTLSNSNINVHHIFINVIFTDENFDRYFYDLTNEIKKVKELYNFKIKTIYIAGKQLSFLTYNQLFKLLILIGEFNTESLIEYTFEYSYNLIAKAKLMLLKKHNVNRLVWRVLTFQQEILKLINPSYNSQIMINNIKNTTEVGFDNFSIDLEYDLAGQTVADALLDVKKVLTLAPPHISFDSYNEVEDEIIKDIFKQLLEKNKYHHYEMFSHCKKQKQQSQQTIAYLTLQNWYGFGPNASSFIKNQREIITINNDAKWQTKKSVLPLEQYYKLVLMQGLTLKAGIKLTKNNLIALKSQHEVVKTLCDQQLLTLDNKTLKTTNQGWLLLNDILTVIINSK